MHEFGAPPGFTLDKPEFATPEVEFVSEYLAIANETSRRFKVTATHYPTKTVLVKYLTQVLLRSIGQYISKDMAGYIASVIRPPVAGHGDPNAKPSKPPSDNPSGASTG